MLNPQASTFSVARIGEPTSEMSQQPLTDSPTRNMSAVNKGSVRVYLDKAANGGREPLPRNSTTLASNNTPPLAMPQSRNFNIYTDVTVPAMRNPRSSIAPLATSTKNNAVPERKRNESSMVENESPIDKNKNFRLEQDRHNLMGVASIWAPRPSEKDLHTAYGTPTLTPSPGLSPTAPMFSRRSPPNFAAVKSVSPMLLAIPQLMSPPYLAPNLDHLGERPTSQGESGMMYAEPLVFQAWHCNFCGGENRFNTETCAHCESLNPNRPLIRAISQQQQHLQAFPPYSSSDMSPITGTEGAKLSDLLVTGDVALCYAMGMRGLVGKEAINPWKCVGVDIPSQNFVKNVSKPPLGTIAGDWTCSCGRENWAKRTVCSRCFPGIEPEYKSLVFSKVKPVLDYIAAQEQNGEAQKDAEWLAAEERRLRQGHLKQMPAGMHSGPIIGKQFVADTKTQRQQSKSPRMQEALKPEQQEHPSSLPPQYFSYPQNLLLHHHTPSTGSIQPAYPYSKAQPASMGGYAVGGESFAFQHAVTQGHDHFNLPDRDREPAPSLQPVSSRFSLVESSESASEYQFSPFSRSGSQQAMPKLGFTITTSSSMASARTAASSSGKSLNGDQRCDHLGELRGPSDRPSSFDRKDQIPPAEHSRTPDPFSPFSQPQLFVKQALQARHKSAKKAELRLTRSVSPIGHGRPEASVENVASGATKAEHSELTTESLKQEQDRSFPSGDSYVNVLGSLLQDVHM